MGEAPLHLLSTSQASPRCRGDLAKHQRFLPAAALCSLTGFLSISSWRLSPGFASFPARQQQPKLQLQAAGPPTGARFSQPPGHQLSSAQKTWAARVTQQQAPWKPPAARQPPGWISRTPQRMEGLNTTVGSSEEALSVRNDS